MGSTDRINWFVAAVHGAAVPQLRELFEDNGGYVLCVDGTCEGGSPVHLVCADSVTGIAPRSKRSASLEQLDREELSLAILWIQAYRNDGRGQGFPFDLPKLAYWRRCARVRQDVVQWWAHSHPGSRCRFPNW